MALTDSNTGTTMLVQPSYCGYGNGGNNGLFGNGNDWLGILFLIALCNGGWGNGFGGFGGSQGAAENYVLTSDFAQLSRQISDSTAMTERKLDSITNGLCDGFYTTAQQINGVNQGIANAQYNLANAVTTGGYETRNAINGIGTQLASCCCDIREGIANVNYTNAMNTNSINQNVSNGFCQTNFNMATNHAQTLQAIDKLGDRFFSYMANRDNQALRDENFALKLAASQERQNNYLVETLGQGCPKTVYVANPPQAVNFPTNYCNNGCNC